MSNGDPIGSEKPRGKSNAKRMGRYDGSYTPTEQRTKDRLMKQFCRDEGPPPSQAYLEAPCWCGCGRLKAEGKGQCQRCLDMDAKTPAVPDGLVVPRGGLEEWLGEQGPGEFYVWNKNHTGFVPEGHPDAE